MARSAWTSKRKSRRWRTLSNWRRWSSRWAKACRIGCRERAAKKAPGSRNRCRVRKVRAQEKRSSTMMRQRLQRKRDPKYLTWLRTQRCACGCLQGPPCDAAHVRAASLGYDKRQCGLGEKPDDKWALPLKHAHHMEQHAHSDGELDWWQMRGIRDPWAICLRHYRRFKREQAKCGKR